MILSCLLLVLISVHAFYQLFYKDSSNWINSIYRNLTITIMISFTMCHIISISYFIVRYFVHNGVNMSSTLSWILISTDIFYYAGNIAFYILLLLRITVPFELSKYVSTALIMLIFVYGIASVWYIVIISLPDSETFQVLIIVLLSIDLILNTFILAIFICKIKKIMQNIDPLVSAEAQKNVDVMTNVVAKHCLLFGTAIIFNQGFLVAVFISTFMPDGTQAIGSDVIVGIAASTEISVNVLVLWLVLRANYDKYICLCKYCHIGIAKCCIKNIDGKRVVENPYKELLVEEAISTVQSSSPVLK